MLNTQYLTQIDSHREKHKKKSENHLKMTRPFSFRGDFGYDVS